MSSSESEHQVKPKSKPKKSRKLVEESGGEEEAKLNPVKRKRKSDAGGDKRNSAKKPRASKSKQPVESEDEGEPAKPLPKAKAKPRSKAKKEPTPASDVMDVDAEPSEAEDSDVPTKSGKKERKRKQAPVIKSREFIEDSDDEEALNAPAPSTSTDPPAKAPKKSKESKSKVSAKKTAANVAEDDAGLRSESEIDVLLDKSSPVKEKGTSGRGRKSDSKEPKPKKSRGKELSKDEEAIKRLKSFIVACGVRKVWSKEFKDMPGPNQQIAHLRKILSDLGMGSRPSMEQARTIRVRRELEQELEDVKEFDAVVNAPRKGRAAAPRHSLAEPGGAADAQSEDEDEDEDPDEKPAPRKKSAFSFLAGQSSDDE